MYQKCQYLRQRSKKGQLYYFCVKQRENVNYDCYRDCLDKEYKVKPIKKVSKKRKSVSKTTYNEVYDRCKGICAICSTNQNLHLHHIDGRGKDLTNDPDNCIMLCNYCHLEVVHKNNKYWRPKLKELIKGTRD